MSHYPMTIPNSIFMTPILQTKAQPTPLFLQMMQKKIVFKNRILKHKKSIKRTIQQTLDEFVDQPKKTLHQLSTTITASKRLWKSRLNNSYVKGEKDREKEKGREKSRLDCIGENYSDVLSYLQLKCSSVFNKKDAIRERERLSSEVKSQILTKMTTAHSQQIMKQPFDKEQKQAVQRMLDIDKPIKLRKKTFRSLSRQSVEFATHKDTSCLRNSSLNPSPKKTAETTKTQEGQKSYPNKPLLRYDAEQLQLVKAESFCVIELTGQMVLNYRGNLACEIASLTKLMTAYLILRICKDFNVDPAVEKIEVSEYVEEITGTSAELIHGDIFTIEQLLYGLLLPSGNDASLVLADWGGLKINKNPKKVEWRNNIARFVQEMTRYSHKLGMKSTRYGNPHGLPHPEALSTAIDQCKMASLCLQVPLLAKIFQTQKYKFMITNSDKRKRDVYWQNTNKLLRREGFIGIKTGITVTAGPCLITGYRFKDKTYIAAVLRSNKVSRRFKDSRKILHWVLSKLYNGQTCFEETLQLEKLRKNNKDLDSDNSQDQQQFRYGGKVGAKEYSRRNKILINDL